MSKNFRTGPAEGRYDYPVAGGIAFADYIRQGDILRVTYTQVPDSLRGRGVGAALVKALLDEVRMQGMKVVPQCSFVAAYIRRHPAMRDLLADEATD
jgi:predicted GNAT family acetyltransferase